MNEFYTHRPYLIRELNKLLKKKNVRVLEFGIGDGSSEIFYYYTKMYSNIKVIGFENDFNWYNKIKSKYENSNYTFEYVSDWNLYLNEYNFLNCYDLIFIDQNPWDARIKTLDMLKNISSTIILHDYDYYNKELIENIYSVGEHSFFDKYHNSFNLESFYETLPPTMIFTKK